MLDSPLDRITPWVGRLLVINAVVLLLQWTILTSEELARLVQFAPALAFTRPWTFFTYMFVHGGLFHLLGNSLALFVFGPAVERRLGSAIFILFYVYCGLGGAIITLLAMFAGLPVGEIVFGASGAVLGVAFAFSRLDPDAELMIFPLPMPIKVKHFIMLIVAFDVIGAFTGFGKTAHAAHLGGMAFAWLFFAMQNIARPIEPPRFPSLPRRIPVPHRDTDGEGRQAARSPMPHSTGPATASKTATDAAANETAELDRVLDKISASGLASLTAEERHFLEGVSLRRKGGD